MRKLLSFPLRLVIASLLLGSLAAHAEVRFELKLWRGYDFYFPSLSLESTNPAPLSYHRVESPSGLYWRHFGTNNQANDFLITNSVDAIIQESTNGLWKLYVNREHPSEQLYFFRVSVSGIASNTLGAVEVLNPPQGATGVTNLPVIHWTGPTNLPLYYVSVSDDGGYYQFANLPNTATNWTPPVPLPYGSNINFLAYYQSNNHPGITFSAATNSGGTPLADWLPTGAIACYRYSDFVVQNAPGGGTPVSLRAHYNFEDGNIFAQDVSGNGNNVSGIASFGGGTAYTTNAQAIGTNAAFFFNNGGAGASWLNPPTNLLATLADSFSVSAWIRTSQTSGADDDDGLFGNAGIVSAFNGSGGNWVIPMCLTGQKLAFVTGGTPQHTLHSATSVSGTGDYVHVVVTRNRASGEKRIYVNGALDATGSGATTLLDTAEELHIGYNNGTGFDGRMDEIQIYSGVLSPAQVAFLYNNPGSAVQPNPLAEAVDAPQFPWTTGGDANWFAQTNVTHDGVDAARSGAIGNDDSSWIETTIMGPGTLSFWWRVSSDDFVGYDYLELTVNGNYVDEIAGESGWELYSTQLHEATNVVRWTYHKDFTFADGADAAWLDQVTFAPTTDIGVQLTIERNQSGTNAFYYAFPYISYALPVPITEHEVESPNGLFTGSTSGSGSASQTSLAAVINEIQAGPWRLYLNRGDASERLLTFTVSVTGLTTNVLPGTTLFHPLNGATNVATNAVFHWQGPTNFSSLFVNAYHVHGLGGGGFASLPVTTTNWPPGPGLVAGTNTFYYAYQSNNFPGVSFSNPLDAQNNGLTSWEATCRLVTSGGSTFVVSAAAPPPAPVTLLNPARSGTNFQFSFLSQAGKTHTVQSRTNLVLGAWQNVTNVSGDGSLKLLSLPVGANPQSYYRVNTQ
mgnify:CR=1 FL=1